MWLFIEIMDFFSIYTKDKYHEYAFPTILSMACLYALFTRRPVTRIVHKARKDYCIEVRIGDLFSTPGQLVISTNTTFDTDLSDGIISPNSVQGQYTTRFFPANIRALDQQLDFALSGHPSLDLPEKSFGKRKEYPIGTVAKIKVANRISFWVAMSKMNDKGNAYSEVSWIDQSLESLWSSIQASGELDTIAIPILGTGRGRLTMPRKQMINRIANSFANASTVKVFSPRLIIVASSADANDYSLNLHEIKDMLTLNLHE